MPQLHQVITSQEVINAFQKKLLEEFDDALVAYLLLFKNPDILKELQHRQLMILFRKAYLYSYISAIIVLSFIFYRFSPDRSLVLNWMQGVFAYMALSYIIPFSVHQLFPREDEKVQKIISVAAILLTGFSLIGIGKNIGGFIFLLVALDQLAARQFATFVTDVAAIFLGNRDPRWLAKSTIANSDRLIHAGAQLQPQDHQKTYELTLPVDYKGNATEKAARYQRDGAPDLRSLEDVLLTALNTLPSEDQLFLRLRLKLLTSEAIVETWVKQLMLEFYSENPEPFNENDIEGRKDYLYSTCMYQHALLPTQFSENSKEPFLSNAVDDLATRQRFQINPIDLLHVKNCTRVTSIENIAVAEVAFMRLHGLLSTCGARFFTLQPPVFLPEEPKKTA